MAPKKTDNLHAENAAWLEQQYQRYTDSPERLDAQWRAYFADIKTQPIESQRLVNAALPNKPIAHAQANTHAAHLNHAAAEPLTLPVDAETTRTPQPPPSRSPQVHTVDEQSIKEKILIATVKLMQAYRKHGSRIADLGYFNQTRLEEITELQPAFYDIHPEHMSMLLEVKIGGVERKLTVRDVIARMRQYYCGDLTIEYEHLESSPQRHWFQEKLETDQVVPLDAERKRTVLKQLASSEGLERYLHSRYVGQKRFSLEGAEALIPALHHLIHLCGSHSLREMIIGMAHRGRLNVLVNILGKTPDILFEEFEGKSVAELHQMNTGDVKYHLGFSSNVSTPNGDLHLALAFNPSHLEIISPVVHGSARARQDRNGDEDPRIILPVVLHGDAAFSGQGVVMETFNMSQTPGYTCSGSIHIVINNQIGFTTSKPWELRSTFHCTDIAKGALCPIIHVSAECPEQVLRACEIAFDYRNLYQRDVVIDLVCYRRHGHNEADDPRVTQPMEYQAITQRPSVFANYTQRLIEEGVTHAQHAAQLSADYREKLQRGNQMLLDNINPSPLRGMIDWSAHIHADPSEEVETRLFTQHLEQINQCLFKLPEDFALHPRVQRIFDEEQKMAAGDAPLSWGYAEKLAYANLLLLGYKVRLSGQDSERGTFFHRHAVYYDQNTGTRYCPLQNLTAVGNNFTVINSPLSEAAIMGFEYGYATTTPTSLVLWEAQFGDFANNAQVVIDQFISSGQAKWQRLCGLVMLLPHGYEGQGPEHSSARLERYLQLSAGPNLQVCVPTTPAQLFHMFTRQLLRRVRCPLIVMMPKSMLRNKYAVSRLEDLTQGGFELVIDDPQKEEKQDCSRVILCSGKVYYDLYQAALQKGDKSTQIMRVEQLHPFPSELLKSKLSELSQLKEIVWCQEEHRNQGAWYQIRHFLQDCLPSGCTLKDVCRPSSAAAAVGNHASHVREQRTLIEQAFNPIEP